MLKKIIAPLRQILLERGICPKCISSLGKLKQRNILSQTREVVICKCGQRYIYDHELDRYTDMEEKK